MGQRIEIDDAKVVDDALILSTNRSLTGTDGEGFDTPEATEGVDTFGAKAAAEVFASDAGVSRVYVASNVLVVSRTGGWDHQTAQSAQKVVEEFFLFYP